MKEKKQEISRNEHIRLITVVTILIALAGVFILYLFWPILTGKTIMLETKPVDSSNIVRDQYLIINYVINTIPLISEAKPGQAVYVSLEKNDKGNWEYQSASLDIPLGFYITGKIISIEGNNMNVQYGIEQYFLKPNSRIPSRNFQVEVRVSKDGRARIEEVYFMGGPVK